MYLTPEFKNTNEELTNLIIKKNPLATLISYHDEICISHIPTLLKNNSLYGHLSKRNKHTAFLENTSSAQLIFNSANSYISPLWYTNSIKNVPTWNYCSVVVKAIPFIKKDPKEILAILNEQIQEYEKNSWSLNNLDPQLIEELISEIVAFEFKIESIQSKFKISQNKSLNDIQNVISHLDDFNSEKDLSLKQLMRLFYAK